MLQGPVSRNAARSRPGWFRLARLQLPYCIRPASLLTNLPACHVCSSAGQTLWNGVTVVQQTHPALCEARRHVGVCKHILDHFCYPFQSSTLFPITFNQGYDSLTVALSPCLSILPWSVLTCPLLQCLFFFSFSLQIHIDIPRTNPLIPLFQQASVQEVRLPPLIHTSPLPAGSSPPANTVREIDSLSSLCSFFLVQASSQLNYLLPQLA